MNQAEFVKVVKTVVRDAAARGVGEILERPPGRKPDPRVRELSNWFLKLPDKDREYAREVAALAADQATYNFLLALDGLLAIAPSAEQGNLQLFYETQASRIRLNDPEGEELSSLFKGM